MEVDLKDPRVAKVAKVTKLQRRRKITMTKYKMTKLSWGRSKRRLQKRDMNFSKRLQPKVANGQ